MIAFGSISRCFPDLSVNELHSALEEAGGYPKCQGSSEIIDEGRKSFPSGMSLFQNSDKSMMLFSN